ncbi:MAG TPA: methyltransferase domain-containing protein [Rhizomicrobium sp.]|nr:methyltransferase domain-containing protein [Rhizomicrobium sp.]
MLLELYEKLTTKYLRRRVRIIFDAHYRVGDFSLAPSHANNLDKEVISRHYVLDREPSIQGRFRFLDVGCRDGKLSYLLGFDGPLHFNAALYEKNKAKFERLYEYYGIDLIPAGGHVLAGDLCHPEFLAAYPHFRESFDIIYSNNVFEHFARPWIAADNLLRLLSRGGRCVTIVPFAQRYHESPGDYFRYTPAGVISMFESGGPIKVLEAGFDIRARRYDWQGMGDGNDIVPVDKYGSWRETWTTVVIFEKL